jgi:hypothetical protein
LTTGAEVARIAFLDDVGKNFFHLADYNVLNGIMNFQVTPSPCTINLTIFSLYAICHGGREGLLFQIPRRCPQKS